MVSQFYILVGISFVYIFQIFLQDTAVQSVDTVVAACAVAACAVAAGISGGGVIGAGGIVVASVTSAGVCGVGVTWMGAVAAGKRVGLVAVGTTWAMLVAGSLECAIAASNGVLLDAVARHCSDDGQYPLYGCWYNSCLGDSLIYLTSSSILSTPSANNIICKRRCTIKYKRLDHLDHFLSKWIQACQNVGQ